MEGRYSDSFWIQDVWSGAEVSSWSLWLVQHPAHDETKQYSTVHRKQFTVVVNWIANFANKLTGWPSLGICTSVCLDWVTRMLFPHTLTLSKWAIAATDIKHWRIQHTTPVIISQFSWEKILFLRYINEFLISTISHTKALSQVICVFKIINFHHQVWDTFQKYLHDFVCVTLGSYKTFSNEIQFLLGYGYVSVENLLESMYSVLIKLWTLCVLSWASLSYTYLAELGGVQPSARGHCLSCWIGFSRGAHHHTLLFKGDTGIRNNRFPPAKKKKKLRTQNTAENRISCFFNEIFHLYTDNTTIHRKQTK